MESFDRTLAQNAAALNRGTKTSNAIAVLNKLRMVISNTNTQRRFGL